MEGSMSLGGESPILSLVIILLIDWPVPLVVKTLQCSKWPKSWDSHGTFVYALWTVLGVSLLSSSLRWEVKLWFKYILCLYFPPPGVWIQLLPVESSDQDCRWSASNKPNFFAVSWRHTGNSGTIATLNCLCCYNKNPSDWVAKIPSWNTKHFFRTVLKAGSLRSRCCLIQCLMRPHFLVHVTVSLHGRREEEIFGVSFIRALILWGQSPHDLVTYQSPLPQIAITLGVRISTDESCKSGGENKGSIYSTCQIAGEKESLWGYLTVLPSASKYPYFRL